MAIVSANANAFESYGLTRAQTSPISRAAGERFGQALNAVLASASHHQSAGRITYVFWARGGVVPLFAFQPPADARDLQKLLTAVHRGDRSWANGLPSNEKFHLFGLTANAARVVVRSALDTTIGEIGQTPGGLVRASGADRHGRPAGPTTAAQNAGRRRLPRVQGHRARAWKMRWCRPPSSDSPASGVAS